MGHKVRARRFALLAFAVVTVVAACTPAWVPLNPGVTPIPSSSASSSPSTNPSPTPTAPTTPTPPPTPTPTPPPPGVLSANPSSLAFFAVATQSVLVQETNFSGTLRETNTCSGIATIAPSSSTSPYTAVVTPVAAGTCTITFTDGTQTAPVSVTVTAQSFTINVKR